jgi:pyrimidine-nucleoside phosphorylase
MNQPLGQAVGNSLEVIEAIETLQGNGPDDLVEHCVEIALHMLRLAGQGEKWTDDDAVRSMLREKLTSGEALEQFRRLVRNQGGDVMMIDDTSKLPRASIQENLIAGDSGYVKGIAADKVGQAALILGAGREVKGAPVDHAVGVEVFVRVGDPVEAGDIVATLHASDPDKAEEAKVLLTHAIEYSSEEVERLPLFYGVLDSRRDLE